MSRIVSSAAVGVEPRTMGIDPVSATQKVLELQKTNKKYALATMCIGVGQGYAIVLERV